MQLSTQTGKTVTSEFSIEADYTAHFLPGTTPEFEFDNDDFLFGCDYATVMATDDYDRVEKFLSLLTENDFEVLEGLGYNCVVVYQINGVYLISVEHECLNSKAAEFASEEMIMFGAGADDVSLPECIPAREYQREKDLSMTELDEMFQDGEFEDSEEFETSVDSLCRIWEYSDDSLHDELMRVLDAVAQRVDANEYMGIE